VRYPLFAVRAAYAPSTPVSAGGCNVPLLLSVPDPPMWQLAHVRSRRCVRAPRWRHRSFRPEVAAPGDCAGTRAVPGAWR
jgi:hypothetical protein